MIATTMGSPSGYYDLAECGPTNPYANAFTGTSAAVPVVSAVAALLKSLRPNLLGEDIEQIINRTALGGGTHNPETGWGLVRADAALDFISLPRVLIQRWLGNGSSWGALSPDSQLVERTFTNTEAVGLPSGTYSCWRYRMSGHSQFSAGFTSVPAVWVRASGSMGWRDPSPSPFDYDQEVRWGQVVPDSLTSTGAAFETFVYRVLSPQNPNVSLGWFPAAPAQARIAYTAVGPSTQVGVAQEGEPAHGLEIRTLPNPSRLRTVVEFELAAPARVVVRVFDVGGREVARLTEGDRVAGTHRLQWDGMNSSGNRCPAGVYVCRLETGSLAATRKFILLGSR